jgi:hypothetical protein
MLIHRITQFHQGGQKPSKPAISLRQKVKPEYRFTQMQLLSGTATFTPYYMTLYELCDLGACAAN